MKLKQILLLAFLGAPMVFAAEEHDHDHDHGKHSGEEHHDHDDHDHDHVKKGPNGGQVVESKEGFAFEVVVDKDRKARVVFLDKDLKPVALENRTITGIAGERSAPVKLTFAKGGEDSPDTLVSDKALPEGAHVPMILVIKAGPDAKAVTERFELHLH